MSRCPFTCRDLSCAENKYNCSEWSCDDWNWCGLINMCVENLQFCAPCNYTLGYHCNDGRCIDAGKVCDQVYDCYTMDDELACGYDRWGVVAHDWLTRNWTYIACFMFVMILFSITWSHKNRILDNLRIQRSRVSIFSTSRVSAADQIEEPLPPYYYRESSFTYGPDYPLRGAADPPLEGGTHAEPPKPPPYTSRTEIYPKDPPPPYMPNSSV